MKDINFILSEEKNIFRETFRRFAEREIKPLIKDAEEKEEIPREVFRRLGSLGYLGIAFPETYSGGNADFLTECIMIEELARVNNGFATSIGLGSAIAFWAIYKFGSETQKLRYLVPANQGKLIGAIAITEPNAGSDVAGIQTSARRVNGKFLINGSKTFITNANLADIMVVVAYTDREKGPYGGTSLIIVERERAGITTKKIKKMCSKSSDTGEIYFENCAVPSENLLGVEGHGIKNILEELTSARVTNAARSLGVAQACFEAAIQYSGERVAFGKPLKKFQATAFKLARMSMEIDIARTYIYQAAQMYENGKLTRKIASHAKLFTSEMAQRVAAESLQIHGAYGVSSEYPIERYFRDTRGFTIGEGTSEIQTMIIAHELGL